MNIVKVFLLNNLEESPPADGQRPFGLSAMIDVLLDGDPQVGFECLSAAFIEDAGAKRPFPVAIFFVRYTRFDCGIPGVIRCGAVVLGEQPVEHTGLQLPKVGPGMAGQDGGAVVRDFSGFPRDPKVGTPASVNFGVHQAQERVELVVDFNPAVHRHSFRRNDSEIFSIKPMLEHDVGVVLTLPIVELEAGFESQHQRPIGGDPGIQRCILHPVGF